MLFGPHAGTYGPLSKTLFGIAVGCSLGTAVLAFWEVAEVNRKLPRAERMFPLVWHIGKEWTLKRNYRRLYPDGRLDLWREGAGWIGLFLALLSGIVAGVWGW
jgi:hypothetical protein